MKENSIQMPLKLLPTDTEIFVLESSNTSKSSTQQASKEISPHKWLDDARFNLRKRLGLDEEEQAHLTLNLKLEIINLFLEIATN